MQEYLRIDTTNPPGNELRSATFFKKILDREGIENRLFEYQPGRANLWARLPHTHCEGKRPIILGNHMDVASSDPFRNIRQALQDKDFQEKVIQDESLNFLLRNTISRTRLGGSERTNVIPPEAWANLDVRLLPGEDPQQFLETIRRVVNDPDVTVDLRGRNSAWPTTRRRIPRCMTRSARCRRSIFRARRWCPG